MTSSKSRAPARRRPSKARAAAAAREHLRHAHGELRQALGPVRVRVDVLRLRTHTSGADARGPQLAATAELYDDVRRRLDEIDRTLERMGEGQPPARS